MHYQQWEYRVEESPDGQHNGQLRNLGGKGWEMVSEVVWEDPKKPGGRVVRAVFKRPA